MNRFRSFEGHVRYMLERPAQRRKYLEGLESLLVQAVKDEEWDAAEAILAGILSMDKNWFITHTPK